MMNFIVCKLCLKKDIIKNRRIVCRDKEEHSNLTASISFGGFCGLEGRPEEQNKANEKES